MKDSPVEWCCTAIHTAGYVCTLNLGHKGAHVAHGTGIVCAEWAAVPEPKEVV